MSASHNPPLVPPPSGDVEPYRTYVKLESRLQGMAQDFYGLDHGIGHPAFFSLSHCSSRWTEGGRRDRD